MDPERNRALRLRKRNPLDATLRFFGIAREWRELHPPVGCHEHLQRGSSDCLHPGRSIDTLGTSRGGDPSDDYAIAIRCPPA